MTKLLIISLAILIASCATKQKAYDWHHVPTCVIGPQTIGIKAEHRKCRCVIINDGSS